MIKGTFAFPRDYAIQKELVQFSNLVQINPMKPICSRTGEPRFSVND